MRRFTENIHNPKKLFREISYINSCRKKRDYITLFLFLVQIYIHYKKHTAVKGWILQRRMPFLGGFPKHKMKLKGRILKYIMPKRTIGSKCWMLIRSNGKIIQCLVGPLARTGQIIQCLVRPLARTEQIIQWLVRPLARTGQIIQ